MDNRRAYRVQDFQVNRLILSSSPRGALEECAHAPQCAAAIGYGNPVGTTNTANLMNTGMNSFEYANIGTQTILAPVFGANGYNIAFDNTNAEGVEITRGITAQSTSAYTVGTDRMFVEVTLKPSDVSGLGELAVGFRKTQAYQLAIDNYTDMAVLNVQAGTINLETILNNAATTTTDTGQTVADNTAVTLRVEVYSDGTCKYYVDGVQVLATNTFTFDSGDVLIPFIHFVNASDVCDTLYWTYWKDGLLDKEK